MCLCSPWLLGSGLCQFTSARMFQQAFGSKEAPEQVWPHIRAGQFSSFYSAIQGDSADCQQVQMYEPLVKHTGVWEGHAAG